jgi:hypothetical protein
MNTKKHIALFRSSPSHLKNEDVNDRDSKSKVPKMS